jgi:predicted Zn-dependent protease
MDETARALTEVFLRAERGRDPRDADTLRAVIRERPEWPIPEDLRAVFLIRQRDIEGALAAFRTAYELDPLGIVDLEAAANILLRTGRTAEARDTLLEVRAVRESPASRELWESLPANLRQ